MRAIKTNWFHLVIVVFLTLASYWFGIRPVEIRKGCSFVAHHSNAVLAASSSNNWPGCEDISVGGLFDNLTPQKSIECYGPKAGVPAKNVPLVINAQGVVEMSQHINAVPALVASANWPDCKNVVVSKKLLNSQIETCNGPTSAQPEKDWKVKATPSEYSQCLREHGI